jgi:hypothetical protein
MDKKFIVNIQGSDFIKHEGLLNEFHENGGKEILTEMLALKDGMCVFKATAIGEKGKFTGHGDASQTNVNKMIAPHYIRMAETRAVNRALRFYNNIGMCSADELGGSDVKPTKENDVMMAAGCNKCGGDMKVSKAGKPYCAKLCWKKDTPDDLPF